MKKLVNLIALVMLVSTNVLTPFSYAQVDIPELIPESGAETVEENHGEIGENPGISEKTPNSLGEVEGEGSLPLVREVVNETSPAKQGENLEGLKEEVEDSLDDVESPTIDENKIEDTEKGETDEVVQQEEENAEIEKQEEKLEGDEVEEDSSLQKIDESTIMEEDTGTSATLLPGMEFNVKLKKLSDQGSATYYYSDNTTIKQIVYTGTMPSGVTTTGISTSDSEKEIIAWYDDGIIYYHTEAETIYMNSDSSYMFYSMKGLTGLDLSSFDISNVKNMSDIFSNCDELENLNLKGWDFSYYGNLTMNLLLGYSSRNLKYLNLTNTKFSGSMENFFYHLSNLKEIILKGIDTSNVSSMYGMFNGCSSLTGLDFSSFDTSNVTSMGGMFYGCSSLIGLDLSSFDTSNVTNMRDMFGGCTSLENLNMSGWVFVDNILPSGLRAWGFMGDAPLKKLNLTNAKLGKNYRSFEYSSELEEVLLNGVDTSQITSMSRMFFQCSNLTWLDLSSFDTSNVTDMSYMFEGCNSLTGINVSKWNTSKVTDMSYMFTYCSSLTGLDLSNLDTSRVTTMYQMFDGSNIKDLNLSGRNFKNLNSRYYPFWTMKLPSSIEKLNIKNGKFSGSMAAAFSGLSNLEELNLDGVDMADVTNINSMFYGCNSLKNLDVSNWDTSNITGANGMFAGCSSLETLKMDGWDFRKIGSPSGMLGSTTSLKSISMSGWKIPENFTHGLSRSWGGGNSPIEEIDVTNWDLSQTRDIQGLFADSRSLRTIKGLDTRDTSNVTNMDQIFFDCEKLVELNIKGWDTSNVTDMSSMFAYCDNLEKIWGIEDINTHNVIDMNQLFYVCTSLIELDLSNWNTSNVTIMDYMFYGGYNIKNLNLSGRDFRKHMNGLSFINFYSLPNLEELNLANARFSGQVNRIFQGLSKLKKLNLEGSDVSNVTSMTAMFAGCSSLTELDLSSWDTSNVKQIYQIFAGMPKLRTIYASDSFIAPDDASSGMFGGTTSVVGGNGTKFDPNYIDKTYALIDKVGQTGYFTDKNAINVKFINTLDGTETTSTFAKGQKLTPPYVDKYHVVGGYLDEEMTQAIDLNKGVDSYSVIYIKYERNGSSGGGGGGGSSKKTDEYTHGSAEDSQKNSEENAGKEISPVSPLTEGELEQPEGQNDAPLIKGGADSEVTNGKAEGFTPEFQQAYKFAHENGITTKDTIQSAQMNGKLTRIAMAKMLSQYAINVLGKEPDVSKGVVKFNDVTTKKDADYDNGVTLAYQLGIMGQNMPGNKFRPNDEVTRAEFATALSRMAYGTLDGEYEATSKYYIHHMEKLVKEGIITKDDPNMKELRGYVMIMLMRSAES